jgi:hypothetical protein
MTAPMTQATYVANCGSAYYRGIYSSASAMVVAGGTNPVTTADAERLRRVFTEAVDFWQSNLNQSYSGEPRGSDAST